VDECKPLNVGKADGADKHRGGAGGDGGASYLMAGAYTRSLFCST